MATGTLYLRPSADISVGHTLYPAGSTSAYLLINEETSDESATYICSQAVAGNVATSKFKLSYANRPDNTRIMVTSATLEVYIYTSNTGFAENVEKNEFILEIDGVEITRIEKIKETKNAYTFYLFDVIPHINEYIAVNKALPDINITVKSYTATSTSSKGNTIYTTTGVSTVYVSLSYEEILGINVHKKVDGAWKEAQAAYQKRNGAWVEMTESEAKSILQNSFCTK